MPYLRLYSRDLPIDQKRVIVKKLIDITLRSLHLRPEQRNQITIQFISLPPQKSRFLRVISKRPEFTLEVIGHNLTENSKRAFAEGAAAMFLQVVPAKAMSRIVNLLGAKWQKPCRIALQFSELSPAVSEPFVVSHEPWAA